MNRETRPGVRMLLPACAAMLALPAAALAHDESGAAGGLLSGMHHPVSGLDHIVAMIAVGLWGAQLGKPGVWLLPVTFPLMMAVGGFLGLAGVPLPAVELGIAFSAIVLGAVVLANAKLPLWAAMLIVGCFAVFHGHAHGTELPESASAALYSIGFVISTGLLHATGIGIGLLQHWKRGAIAVRFAGCLVTMAGVYFAWGVFA
ncbi:MAG: HupE/UreJ family protein [Phycisphaerales bacterium]|nr:HupE/UreJ family protein [Phycisphaerales bacterium]